MILETALMCMATNIYHEAKNQPMAGQIAVAQVVMNRVKDNRYPDNVCDVIKQGLTYKNGKVVLGKCQFSWYCDGKKDIVWVSYMDGTIIEANYIAWRDSVNVALFVMSDQIGDITDGADHYYNYNIANPYWVGAMTETVIIGNHRFMKEKK